MESIPFSSWSGQEHWFWIYLIKQVENFCTPGDYSCHSKLAEEDFGCKKACTGLHADVAYNSWTSSMEDPQLKSIIEMYEEYKANYARNILFDLETDTKG